MDSVLTDLLYNSDALNKKKAEIFDCLKDKKNKKNRLRTYYELIILAQACLETAAEIDFSNFLKDLEHEIENVYEKANNMVIENQEHYKWSEKVRASIFNDTAVSEEIISLSNEIKNKLDHIDELLAQEKEKMGKKNFDDIITKL